MKTTALTSIHEKMGAKMTEFAGFKMPLQFEGVTTEHNTVREKLGVFDVSHMGEFWVKGPNAFELIQKITSNDAAKLYDGKVQYNCMPNEQGGIVDDFLVYREDENTYMLVVNAANISKDWNWINKHNTMGAELYNASDETSLMAVQGPKALKAMQKLTDEDILNMKFYTFKRLTLAGANNVILSTTGYTGSGGCEIYTANEDAPAIYKKILEAGEEFGIKPIGLAARDTLRLEAGLCLYGNDLDDTTSPIEAPLSWITKFNEGNNFINREYHEKLKAEKPSRKLRGFEMIDKGVPRPHYEITDKEGNRIGEVTSGTMAPYINKAIGMGYIQRDKATFGDEIYVKMRNKLRKARVVRLPFYKPE
ncbi:MAG: glycine cleavage system aminomethyltransferase GcvT [Bacteroidales bacterium]|nr:glycine cleavage system aminomethyltransferase GcvT [Bacteroidales bacterium]